MKVYINGKTPKDPRRIVEATLIEEKRTTVLVRLPDGHIIIRKKKRDIPQEESK